MLSAIYQGQITKWNASQIASLNPGVTLPSIPIVTLHRSDSSGDTFLFTQYLSKTDPSGWGAKIGFNTTVPWPAAPGALGETGNSGMVSGCKATPGCIAYVGISYLTQALQAGLGYAQLQNAKGQYEVPTRGVDRGRGGRLRQEDAGQRDHLADLRPGQRRLPDHQLRVRHRLDPPVAAPRRPRTSARCWSGRSTRRTARNTSYLSQVNFQPLPSKVEAQSVKQILSIQ